MARPSASRAASSPAPVAPAPSKITAKNLRSLGRPELITLLQRNRAMFNEWVRRMVLQHHRVDILAEVVLGYKVTGIHRRMLLHQFKRRESQVLVFRGAGKSTMCTTTWCIFLILLSRDVRILLASKTGGNAEGFLREIKTHFEANERLREIFGDFVGTEEWTDTAITVKGRLLAAKEPTINTVGVGGAVASKHYDVIIGDDLVDEENSRTKFQRDKMVDWFYKVLLPTLLRTSKVPFGASLHVVGTRYHYEDIYGHFLQKQPDGTGGEMGGENTLTIPALNPDGTSAWEEQLPAATLQAMKVQMGLIRFNSQFQCDCDAMKGSIFRYDDCQQIDATSYPPVAALRVYLGIDLAISESEKSDMFAIVVIGRDAKGAIFILEYFEAHLRFPEQTAKIKEMWLKWKPQRMGIEINAYQAAQYQQSKAENPGMNFVPITTLKDKVTRAWKLSPHFEAKRVYFQRYHLPLIEHLVLFPGYRYKDLFDALDMAVAASEARVRKQRAYEPGLI